MNHSHLELLESRIAPAVILSFTDGVDGDLVKLVSNKALTATITSPAGDALEITLSGMGLDGASLTTVVTRVAGGDGFVNIGEITTSLDLGAVTIKGDLGRITAGNSSNPLPGIKLLKVQSMGLFGTETQVAGNLFSSIGGDFGRLEIASDAVGVRIAVGGKLGTVKIGGDLRGGASTFSGRLEAASFGDITIGGDLVASTVDETGKIVTTLAGGGLGKLTIRGSMQGALDAVADPKGQIYVGGNAGPIFIGREVIGAVNEQKAIEIVGNASAITIGGSLRGNAGLNSGSIFVGGSAGVIKIGRDIEGSSGNYSGAVLITGTVAGFSVGGDVIGGTGEYQDGFILQQIGFAGSTGPVKIVGDIIGKASRGSATVTLGTGAPSFFLGGSLVGGGLEIMNAFSIPSGAVQVGNVGSLTVGGNLLGSAFTGGQIIGGAVGKLLIKGSLLAPALYASTTNGAPLLSLGSVVSGRIEGSLVGSADPSGLDVSVLISGSVGALTIVGSLRGDAGDLGGTLQIGGNITKLTIGGSMVGGTGTDTAGLVVGGRVGALTVNGGVDGGIGGYNSAQIRAASFGKVLIRGDLEGSAPNAGTLRALTGGIDSFTLGGSLLANPQGAAIIAAGAFGPIKIGGDVVGSPINGGGSIVGLKAASIAIGGDLVDTGGTNYLLISMVQSAGKITIGGDIRGTEPNGARIIVGFGAGFTAPGFTSLLVKGSVSNALIAGGLRNDLFITLNPDAVLGPVTVNGNWTASSIAASVNNGGAAGYFGDGTDQGPGAGTAAISKISAITIRGQVLGTAMAGDSYGFEAQSIGPVKIGGITYLATLAPTALGKIFDDVILDLFAS